VDLSIIIINYNTFELSCQCIQSVMNHVRSLSYEIILVDNASVERPASDFVAKFPGIRLIANSLNEGFAKGNNTGISVARGEVILLLNSDVIVKEGAIEESYRFLNAHEKVAAVTCRLVYPDGIVQHNCQRFPSIRYSLFELFRLQKFLPGNVGGKILLGPFFGYDSIVYPDWIWGTFFMFRKKMLKELHGGKLADEFFMYGEDMQWCKDFQRLGYTSAFIPGVEVIHYMGKSKGAKNELMHKNHRAFLTKYYGRVHIWIIDFLRKILER
jgi:GT2 family glycosyltransferase